MTIGRNPRPLVLTGASHRYARTLFQFLLSAERMGEDRNSDWIVYDLGLGDDDRDFLARRFPWGRLQSFPFADYPPHVRLETGSYAWKPLILARHETHPGPLFWFDSGTILQKPLDDALAALGRQGFWALRSQEPLDRKCDVRVMDAVGVQPEVRHFREYAAGAVGFDPRLPLGRRLLADWAFHAAIEDHIVPQGYAAFHKHDQAVLNCLLARAAFEGRFAQTTEEIDICSARPSRLISTRNFVPNGRPLWADPALRAGFAAWKAGDRVYHRLRIFDDTRIDGWRRRRQDHFSVILRDLESGRESVIPFPEGYYADPFITRRDGQLWLFVEAFVYARDRGHLVVMGIDEQLRVTSTQDVEFLPDFVALDCHASFPYIFEMDGETYMIPETFERRAVDLFVCARWPDRWRLVRRLLSGRDAVDSMLVRRDGLWYLITSVQGEHPNRHLEIHMTDDLLSGCFTPHPVNNRFVYGSNAHGTGRNAGFIQEQPDGSLIRLMQNSNNHYGESIRLMRIVTLNPHEFREEPIEKIDFLPGIVAGFPTHHATRTGNILAFDTRDRVG